MITFKSTEDLSKLSPSDPAYPTVKELIEQLITAYSPPGRPYDAEDDGYIILIEPEDADRTLDELWDGCTLLNIPWEGIMRRVISTSPSISPTMNMACRLSFVGTAAFSHTYTDM
jgi:hypothetical protein